MALWLSGGVILVRRVLGILTDSDELDIVDIMFFFIFTCVVWTATFCIFIWGT